MAGAAAVAAEAEAVVEAARPTTASTSPRTSSGSTKHRRTKVRLSCGPTAGKQCKGIVTLTRSGNVRMGRKAFAITANKNQNVTVRINRSAFRRLKRTGSIKTKITVVTRGSDGKLRKKSQRVTMVRKK